MSQKKFVEKILCSGTFYFENRYRLVDKVENCGTAFETADDQMAHANCMLDT
jgi:hypothetical protein